MIDFASRYRKILDRFLNIDAFLISNPNNLRYLTGLLLSDAEFVLTPYQNALFVDSRYFLEAQQSSLPVNVEVIQFKDKYKEIPAWLSDHSLRQIGAESGFLSYHTFCKWQEKVSGQLVPCENIIEKIRMIKDDFEVQLIRKSINIVAEIIKKIPNILNNQITERDLSLEIEYLMKKEGAERVAFDTIVAAGERAAMPHAAPTDRKLQRAETVLIDLGAVFEGYHSDLTRTFYLGERPQEAKKLFQILQSAQEEAIKQIRPGVKAKDIDAFARTVIIKAGYGPFFGHGTGHGVGIEIHELPQISPASETVLEEGMVFTVEPGIYLPHQIGMRLEDVVLVTRQGSQVLTRDIPREMNPI